MILKAISEYKPGEGKSERDIKLETATKIENPNKEVGLARN
jgi:hypothetical protein